MRIGVEDFLVWEFGVFDIGESGHDLSILDEEC